MKRSKHFLSALLTLALCAGLLTPPASAVDRDTLDRVIADTAGSLCAAVKNPQVGSVGGEWAVLSLARGGYAVPEGYYRDYLAAVEAYVAARDGVLHERKYTEYSRVILALSSLGADARDVAGYDLTKPLGDYERTVWQGLNGPIWALLALDCRDYPMPQNPQAKTQATRQMYLEHILARQNPDGGWSLTVGTPSEPDMTGMALQALAKYRDQSAVALATEKALSCMSQRQGEDGGYSDKGVKSSEGCVQMLVALCELGLPVDDPRFVKGGKTLLDNLLTFYREGQGFLHTIPADGSDLMATEQALYALAAVARAGDKKNSLYRMADAAALGTGGLPGSGAGLAGKDAAVRGLPITHPGATFADLAGHQNRLAIEALAARGIANGKPGGGFDPDGSMTRAEFATLAVKALGLTPKEGKPFSDVSGDAWYAGAVGTASAYGIVNGSDGAFLPLGTITRQEAAVMVANAAKLCGVEGGADQRILSQFTDRVDCAAWARSALALCYERDLLPRSDVRIRPTDKVTRAEVAQMLFNLLSISNLL